MKTYFRLLSFAKPIGKFAYPYFIFTLLFAVFNTVVFSLLMPVLSVLFDQTNKTKAEKITELPAFNPSFEYLSDVFNYFLNFYTIYSTKKNKC